MDRKTLERIVKLLALTQSDSDHEALSAIRNVNRMLKENKLSWEKLLPFEMLPEPPRAPEPQQSAAEDLLEQIRRMRRENDELQAARQWQGFGGRTQQQSAPRCRCVPELSFVCAACRQRQG